MEAFAYRNGVMHAEDVALTEIAQAVGTPFYCYSSAAMARQYHSLVAAFEGTEVMICYAMKANSNQAVIRTFAELGAGADIVSVGELQRALAAGVPGKRIIFAGVGKTRAEMAAAVDAGIFQFNVESLPELEVLSEVATAAGVTAMVAVRVNPDIDAGTHRHITTGTRENKFGIPWDRVSSVYRQAAALPGLNASGIALHIGSQLVDLAPLEASISRVVELVSALRADGHEISHMDLGGGLGITYDDEKPISFADYAAMVKRRTAGSGLKLVCEPGRIMVGNAGVLVSKVIYVKDEGRRFVVLDSAMNDLIRPALYDAWHDFVPVVEAGDAATEAADLVGPICESTDRFAEHRQMPPLAPDDLIAIKSAGAYCAVMSSTYNSRPLIPEVLVKDGRFAIVRRRMEIEELIEREPIPDWLV